MLRFLKRVFGSQRAIRRVVATKAQPRRLCVESLECRIALSGPDVSDSSPPDSAPTADKIVLAIHCDDDGADAWDDGHCFVTITVNGKTTAYGLWPDFNPDIVGTALDNGKLGTDVRVNYPGDDPSAYDSHRYYELTEEQLKRFKAFVERKSYWTVSNTCAPFARDCVGYTTGEKLNADDWKHLGADTPIKLIESIEKAETSNPTTPDDPLPPTGKDPIISLPPIIGMLPPIGVTPIAIGVVGVVTQGPSGGGSTSGPVP